MARKRKTLKEKKQASKRKLTTITTAPQKVKTVAEDELLAVPSRYITQDLIKTAVLSILFLGIILGLYWYLQGEGTSFLQNLL